MNNRLLLAAVVSLTTVVLHAQPCAPAGDEISYGANDTWIGYVYNSTNFTNYVGYVTEGSSGNPNFYQTFGGSNTTYNTNGCSINTNYFTVRYKLQKTFTNATYDITVGGDDGYRLSLDGGATWVIDNWRDQSYTLTTHTILLNGTYNMVLEYYENQGDNIISFDIQSSCAGSENTTTYGTADSWIGYVYDGTNFNYYRGAITQSLNFYQNFGGDNTTFFTTGCSVQTETFSVRYRLRKNFNYGSYTIVVGADDGYRLSLDGGSTWVVDQWWDHGYNETIYITNLSGNVDMVLDYYENGGGNVVSFNIQNNYILPVTLLSFKGTAQNNLFNFNWVITGNSNPNYFQLQQSNDGIRFTDAATIAASNGVPFNGNISFQHQSAQTEAGYYRLKIIDQQGVITYSQVIQLKQNNSNKLQVFPTVLRQQAIQLKTQQLYQNATAQLYNAQGILVWQQKLNNVLPNRQIALPIQQKKLASGTYVLSIYSSNHPVQSTKIVIPAW